MFQTFTSPRRGWEAQRIWMLVLVGGLVFLLCGLIGFMALVHQPPVEAQADTRLIVFLWDGAQRNHFLDAYNAGELPRLQALVDGDGLLRTDLFINTETCQAGSGDGYDTETGPASSALLTGYAYPEMANQDNGNPQPIPVGYTFFERLKAAHPEVKTGMITGKNFPFWPTVPLSNARPTIDYWYQQRAQNDVVADEAITFLQEHSSSPFFLWVHFRHPDEAGHRFGENSDTYHAQLLDADAQMGRTLDELAAIGILSDTTILVTTDHGFGEGQQHHEECVADNKDLWIAGSRAHVIGNLNVPPYQTAFGATLFDIFGLDKNVNPPLASESLWTDPGPPLTPTPTPSATPTPTPSVTPTPTPGPAPPETGSFAPDGGSGSVGQPVAFTTTYHDAEGWQDLHFAYLVLNVRRTFRQGLFVRYSENDHQLSLRNDAGNGWVGTCAPGEATVLSNSYAALDCGATTVSGSDDTLTVTWVVTPLAPFCGQYGTYNAYLLVWDDSGSRDGWDLAGTWTLEE